MSGGGLTVKQLIAHLQKYPGNLLVSVYRPPFRTAYRIVADPKQWLYNKNRLYIPTVETRTISLPATYKIPKVSRRTKKNDK